MEPSCKDETAGSNSFLTSSSSTGIITLAASSSQISASPSDPLEKERICTHILAFEGDGNVVFFEGSYTDYKVNKLRRLGLEEPRRIRYRKLE